MIRHSFRGLFRVDWDLDGYDLAPGFETAGGDSRETRSGLVGQQTRGGDPTPGLAAKGVKLTLVGGGSSESKTFQTDVLAGDNSFIFFGLGGSDYVLTVDGSVGPNTGIAALYDLKVAAVPLPAPFLLLISAFAGLAFVSRYKSAAA